MRITRSDTRRLVVVDFPYLIGAICFPCAAFMGGRAALLLWRGDWSGDLCGLSVGALLFFLGGTLGTKRSEFDFDLVERKLRWKRRGLFTNTGGVVPIDQIRHASVESMSSDGDYTYRVVVHTNSGAIPLTEAYDGNRDKADRVRTAINDALQLKLDADKQLETDILDLTLAGRKIDAIGLARQRYGYDLTTAKDFVESLSK